MINKGVIRKDLIFLVNNKFWYLFILAILFTGVGLKHVWTNMIGGSAINKANFIINKV